MGAALSQANTDSSSPDSDITIAVIGRRGVGKSSFINIAVEKDILTVGRAAGRMKPVELVPTEHDIPLLGRRKIIFMEVPSFEKKVEEEDHGRKWLEKISSTGDSISGILYLHPITDPKIPSTTSWLRALHNDARNGQAMPIVLVTTMWGKLRSRGVGEKRQQAIEQSWVSGLAVGHIVSQVMDFDDTMSCAWLIVSALLDSLIVPLIFERLSKERNVRDLPSYSTGYANKPLTPPQTPSWIERRSMYEKPPPISEKPKESTCPRPSDSQHNQGKPSKSPKKISHSTTISDSELCARRLILEIIKDPDQSKEVVALQDQEAQDVVDYLSELLDRRNEEVNSESKRILALLCDLAKAANVSPKCYELKGIDPDKFGQVEASGGFADVYKHNYKNHVICLKAVRQSRQKSQNLKYLKAHIRELILWSRLRHENILPFYGVYFLENTARLCIISPWMENGNLRQFLEIFPAEPRHPFASDIVIGLAYLHQKQVIHGDLKALNVLVSTDKRALIADFGLSRVKMDTMMILSTLLPGTMSWTAPELLGAELPPTEESDIWSLGCVLYEVFTRKIPFYQYRGKFWSTFTAITNFETPCIPETVDLADAELDKVDCRTWNIITKCWEREPTKRISLRDLLNALEKIQPTRSRPTDQLLNDKSAFWQEMRVKLQTTINYAQVLRTLERISNRSYIL